MKKTLLVLFLILIIIPAVYGINLLDALKGGMEAITGRSAVTVSISVGNNAPNISYVSLDKQTYAPTDGALTKIGISFLADDPEGLSNLDNASARANVSLSGINLTFTTDYTQNNPSFDCSNLSDSPNTNENRTVFKKVVIQH